MGRSPLDRLLEKTEVTDGCWMWTASLDKGGYGRFGVSSQRGGWVPAHRAAYELLVGPIPEGLDLDHTCHSNDKTCPGGKCRHRMCVNPAHLEPVTRAVNIKRGVGPGAASYDWKRAKTHCPKGHPYDDANTYIAKKGSRNCRACSQANVRRWQELHKKHNAPGDRTRCPQGHPYSGDNLVIGSRGARRCRACLDRQKRESRLRRTASMS